MTGSKAIANRSLAQYAVPMVGIRQYIREVVRVGLEVHRPLNVALTIVVAAAFALTLYLGQPFPPAAILAGLLACWVFLAMAPYHLWKRLTLNAVFPFSVAIPGDERSHFTSKAGGEVGHFNLRVLVTNESPRPLRNFMARLTDITPLGGAESPVIGHHLHLPCAIMADGDPYAPTDIPIGGVVAFGVVRSKRESPHFEVAAKKFPTTFAGGVLAMNADYDLTVLVACDTAAAKLVIRARVDEGAWDRPSFGLISVEPLSSSVAA
jgi:hypothetical protein